MSLFGGKIAPEKLSAIIEDQIKRLLGVLPLPTPVYEKVKSQPFIDSVTTKATLEQLAPDIPVEIMDYEGADVRGEEIRIRKLSDFNDDKIIGGIAAMAQIKELIDFLTGIQGRLLDDEHNKMKHVMLSLVDHQNQEQRANFDDYLQRSIAMLSADKPSEFHDLLNLQP